MTYNNEELINMKYFINKFSKDMFTPEYHNSLKQIMLNLIDNEYKEKDCYWGTMCHQCEDLDVCAIGQGRMR